MAHPKQKYYFWPAVINCGLPVFFSGLAALTAFFASDRLLSNTIVFDIPSIWGVILLECGALSAVFRSHFNASVRNWIVWPAILFSGVFVILFFAFVYASEGLLCTAPVCPNTIAVSTIDPRFQTQLGEDLPNLPSPENIAEETETVQLDLRVETALYLSSVTFTTLGYGDFQPSPRLRVVAGIQAVLGYAYLGLCVGLLIDLGGKNAKNRSGSGAAKPRRSRPARYRRQKRSYRRVLSPVKIFRLRQDVKIYPTQVRSNTKNPRLPK